MDIDAFIAHLAALPVAIDEAAHSALEECAELVEQEAKAEIGTYQTTNMGPFTPWAELADSTKEDRTRKGFPDNEPLLRAGELRDSISHSVEGGKATIGSDSKIAVYQEMGTDRIPPRPFLGPALFRNERHVVDIIGRHVAAAVSGKPLAK